MRVFVNKKDWEWFKLMSEEGRTRELTVSSYPNLNPETNIEIELELRDVNEVKQRGKNVHKRNN